MRVKNYLLFSFLLTCFLSVTACSGKDSSRFHKVIYIVLENTSAADALKNPVLKKFADEGVYFSNFMAETHPSQGNYIAMIAGDLLGVIGDENYDLPQDHLGDLLEAHNMTWRNYAEDFPGHCFTGETFGKYARKHVPFISFNNVTNNPVRCSNIIDIAPFIEDWKSNRLANFNLIIPNLDNDGHDTNVDTAAEWVERTILPMLDDPKNMEDTVLILTFDEATLPGENLIYTALYSPTLPMKRVITIQANHISILKWIEDEWNLGNLGRGDATEASLGL